MRKALMALALGGFGIGMTEFVMMGILPEVAGAFDISIPRAGHFISAYALGVVVGAPTLTLLSSKLSQKNVLLGLMAWFALFNSLTAFASSYDMMMLTRFLSGLPHGAFFGVGAVVARKLAREGKAAQAVAVMFGGLTVANIIGVPLGTYVSQHFDWRITFGLVGLVGLGTMLSLFSWMPDVSRDSSTSPKKALSLFKNREPWLVFMVTAIGTGGFFAWYSYVAPLITEVAGFEAQMVTYILVIAGIGMTVGNIIGGQLADRYSPVTAAAALLVCMGMSLLLLTLVAGNKIAVVIMTFVIGTIALALASPVQMLMINASKGSEELGSSLNQAAFNIANALGAYLGGLPIAFGYGYLAPELVGAALAFSGALFAVSVMILRAGKFNILNRSIIRVKRVMF